MKSLFKGILIFFRRLFRHFRGGKFEKPIIYLYPLQKTKINVKLSLLGSLTYTYPIYDQENGWDIWAYPNGKLIDNHTDKEYYALFWEGEGNSFKTPETGFIVKGEETVSFLEEKLEFLGLSRREANEFIIYWLPFMEKNSYNFIHFAQEAYISKVSLEVTPRPDTLIRVFMLYAPLKFKRKIKEQTLNRVERKGFTVVEWGGTETNIT